MSFRYNGEHKNFFVDFIIFSLWYNNVN